MYKARRFSEAIVLLDKCCANNPAEQAQAHYYKGLCCQSLNQVAQAEAEFRWVAANAADAYLRSYAQTALDQLASYKTQRNYSATSSNNASGLTKTAARKQVSAPGGKSLRGLVHGRPVVLDSSTSWCGWCKKMEPTLEEAQSKFSGRIEFRKLDGDDPANDELKQQLGVTGYPHFTFLDSSGQVVNTIHGYRDEDSFIEAVQQLVGH